MPLSRLGLTSLEPEERCSAVADTRRNRMHHPEARYLTSCCKAARSDSPLVRFYALIYARSECLYQPQWTSWPTDVPLWLAQAGLQFSSVFTSIECLMFLCFAQLHSGRFFLSLGGLSRSLGHWFLLACC